MLDIDRDNEYLSLVIEPIKICAAYKPKMGQGKGGFSLEDFQTLYRSDPFYTWFGLDNPLMYMAHKSAGGMTSIYRQIGIGCERLFRKILQDSLGLSISDSQWSYEIKSTSNKTRTLYLDGRIPISSIKDINSRIRVSDWINECAKYLSFSNGISTALTGSVFEVRQGYKSKDAKRQNADIGNASTAIAQAYLPCIIVLSSQIDISIADRYRSSQWIILTGSSTNKSIINSTYVFMNDVIGYDLAGFFERNSDKLQLETNNILEFLLSTKSVSYINKSTEDEFYEDI